MDLGKFRRLIMRAVPGLGGWHVVRFGKVVRVYPAMGTELKSPARVVVDLEVLGPDLKRDERFKKPLMRIPLSSANPYDDTAPERGRICLYQHPYWRADLAVVTGYLFTGRSVRVASKMVHFRGFSEFRVGSAEDYAVLYSELKLRLEELADLIETSSLSDSWGAPNQNLVAVQTEVAAIKTKIALIKAPVIRLGKLAK